MESRRFAKITIMSCLVAAWTVSSLAHATCTWEDKEGVFHMTDDRSQAPRKAKCDQSDPAPVLEKPAPAAERKTYKTDPADLGYDDDANRYTIDFDRISLESGYKLASEEKMTQFSLTVPVNITYQDFSLSPHTINAHVQCGSLGTNDSLGVQVREHTNLSYKQLRLLRKNACEHFNRNRRGHGTRH